MGSQDRPLGKSGIATSPVGAAGCPYALCTHGKSHAGRFAPRIQQRRSAKGIELC